MNTVDLNREKSTTVTHARSSARTAVGFAAPPAGTIVSGAVAGLYDKADLWNLIQDAVIVRRFDGEIVDWNQAAAALYGFKATDRKECSLHTLLRSRFAEGGKDVLTWINQDLQASDSWTGTLLQQRQDRTTITVQVRAAVTRRDALGNPTLVLEVGRAVSEHTLHDAAWTALKNENERMTEQVRLLREELHRYTDHAHRDALTGLLNRRAFYRSLDVAEQSVRGGGSSFAVMLMDLDNFKFFNDAYGHLAGDTVLDLIANALKQAAMCLAPTTNQHMVLARLGGDEFAALLPNCDPREARRWITAMKQAMENLRFVPPGHEHPVPVALSAGGAVVPDEAEGAAAALTMADERLYHDKRQSRELWSGALRSYYSETIAGFGTLDSILRAVDAKDRYTLRHTEDVLIHAIHIGQEMNLSQDELEWLQIAACLHDIGKVGVPDNLLRMPGPLSPSELVVLHQSPTVGAALVGAMPDLLPVVPIVRHHHERWDGRGYPDGLAGQEIPLMARILAVADSFSAMTTNRPYRQHRTTSEAMEELQAGIGTQFDPNCVAAFMRVSYYVQACREPDKSMSLRF